LEAGRGPAGAQILFETCSARGRGVPHGPGIDTPVSLWRSGTTMVLHANRGGLIDMATYTNGTRVDPLPHTGEFGRFEPTRA
jgi:hypothetical protein